MRVLLLDSCPAPTAWPFRMRSNSRDEAATVLFALDAAMEIVVRESHVYRQVEEAARIIVEKFLPDLPDL